jgi:hypothetical protein
VKIINRTLSNNFGVFWKEGAKVYPQQYSQCIQSVVWSQNGFRQRLQVIVVQMPARNIDNNADDRSQLKVK